MKIVKEEDMHLLSRKDYLIEMDYESATPSKDEVKKKLAAHLHHDESLIVLKHIYPRFGEKIADIIAYAYKDAESLKKIEEIKKKAKKDGKEKGKEQAAK